MNWLLNLGWVLWAVSALVYLIERQRGGEQQMSEHARVQALAPEELRDADFKVLLAASRPSLQPLEANQADPRHAIILLLGLVLLAAAQGLSFSS